MPIAPSTASIRLTVGVTTVFLIASPPGGCPHRSLYISTPSSVHQYHSEPPAPTKAKPTTISRFRILPLSLYALGSATTRADYPPCWLMVL